MSLTGLKLSQINGAQEPLKDTDLFYYVTQSPGPIFDSKKGDVKLIREYVDATDRPITIDLATVPKNSGIVLTLTDISTNITDKLTTKTVKQLLVFKDTAGVVTEAAGTAGVSIAGQVVSIVYKGIAAKVIKTLITVNVEVLSEDNAVA